jgi:predicted  nucleic acid-binding Zn-ribbon protein
MSDSQAYEEITVVSDGVTVTKRFEADEFPVPAIAFNFESDRNEPVTVTLTDVVPDDVAVEDLGFHPEYGSEYWTIDDDQITFEREIEPGSDYTTVYGIRATGTDNVEQFLTEPTIDRVDPPLEDDEGELVGEGSDAVKDVISGDADSVPGLEDADDEEIETLDLKDPNNEAAAQRAASSESSGETDEDGDSDEETATTANGHAESADVEISGDNIVAAMADQLRNNQVTKEDVQILRKAFDLASENDGSSQARCEELQRDVTDVIAYTDALEQFLDENGTGDEMLEQFQTEIESFRSEVESFDSQLADVQSSTSQNDEEIGALASNVESMEGTVNSVESTVDEVESEVGDVESQVSDLESQLDDVQSDLEEIKEQMSETDVETQIEEIDEEIKELNEWREQLSSVIGGGGS